MKNSKNFPFRNVKRSLTLFMFAMSPRNRAFFDVNLNRWYIRYSHVHDIGANAIFSCFKHLNAWKCFANFSLSIPPHANTANEKKVSNVQSLIYIVVYCTQKMKPMQTSKKYIRLSAHYLIHWRVCVCALMMQHFKNSWNIISCCCRCGNGNFTPFLFFNAFNTFRC